MDSKPCDTWIMLFNMNNNRPCFIDTETEAEMLSNLKIMDF